MQVYERKCNIELWNNQNTILNCVSYQKHSHWEVRILIFMKIYLTKITKYQLFAANFNEFINSMAKYEKKLL